MITANCVGQMIATSKMDLVTNDAVITDAIKFVHRKKEGLTKGNLWKKMIRFYFLVSQGRWEILGCLRVAQADLHQIETSGDELLDAFKLE